MMKKLLSLGLILCMLMGLFSGMVTVQAADSGNCGDDLSWSFRNGVLTISGSGPMTEYEDMDDVPWEPYRDEIEEVVVGEGVTALGDWSIYRMKNLRKVTLPQSLKRLETAVFCACDSLTELTLPDGIEHIGNLSVTDMESLVRVNVPDSLREMGLYGGESYNELINLEEFIIDPNHPLVMHQEGMLIYRDSGLLFSGAAASGDVVIPAEATAIESSAFLHNNKITSVSVTEGVTEIQGMAFYRCENLTEAYLPASLSYFGYEVFGACEALTEVRYGGSRSQWDAIEFQVNNMTSEDDGLAVTNELLVPNSVPYYTAAPAEQTPVATPAVEVIPQEDAYTAPAPATSGTCGANVMWEFVEYYDEELGEYGSYLSIYGSVPMDDYADGTDAPWASVIGNARQISVGEGVTAIGDNAFVGCENLDAVFIAGTVEAFGEGCFRDCPVLEVIFYDGTLEQWQQAQVGADNDTLLRNLCYYDPSDDTYHALPLTEEAPAADTEPQIETPAQPENVPVVTQQEQKEDISPVTIILVAVVAVLVVAIAAAIIVIVVVLKRTKPQPAAPDQPAAPAQPEQPVVTQSQTQGFYSQYRDPPSQYNREE